jgi:hypothetical protein
MELRVLNPFGDYETEGYLRNRYKEKEPPSRGALGNSSV